MVFVIDSESQLGAFDAKTGDDVWQVELPPEEEDFDEEDELEVLLIVLITD